MYTYKWLTPVKRVYNCCIIELSILFIYICIQMIASSKKGIILLHHKNRNTIHIRKTHTNDCLQ